MSLELILGTAGHIDHGKTSLVRALTGVDTDRLPEEKRRGITIDIGFAALRLGDVELGIVDVPGHERYVRNMLAGATGIDLALLVIAADDSIKPQTREHLEILRLLRLREGVIALTKVDLVQPDWIELVTDEIRDLVRGTFLEQAPIVPTSTQSGAGIDALKAALLAAAQRTAADPGRGSPAAGPFRMPIDRAFTVAGHGAVVTGSVSRGRVAVGDSLRLEPGGREVRVRGIQHHDRPAEEAHRGQRAALNLVGVHHEEIHRGQELATPGLLVPSRLLSARLQLLPGARPLKNRSRVRLHLGAAELQAGVVLLDRDRLEPGTAAACQFFLAEPAVSSWDQAFVIRSESPVYTLGGGRILDPTALRVRRRDEAALRALADLAEGDLLARAAAAVFLRGTREWGPLDLVRAAGAGDPEAVVAALLKSGQVEELRLSPTRKARLAAQTLEALSARAEEALARLHAAEPLLPSIEQSKLARKLRFLGPELLTALLERMQRRRRVDLRGLRLTLAGHGPQLSANEKKLLDELVARIRAGQFQPPSVQELQKAVLKNQQSVPQLVRLAASEGQLVEIGADLFLHAETEAELRARLAGPLAAGPGLTVAEIRDLLGASRKFVVPICEYLDRVGFTRRAGDLRTLAAASDKPPPA